MAWLGSALSETRGIDSDTLHHEQLRRFRLWWLSKESRCGLLDSHRRHILLMREKAYGCDNDPGQ